MQLKEEKMLTQTAINDVVKGCQDVVSRALNFVRAKVCELPQSASREGIIDAIGKVSDPFAGLYTSYLQDKFISECIVCDHRIIWHAFTLL